MGGTVTSLRSLRLNPRLSVSSIDRIGTTDVCTNRKRSDQTAVSLRSIRQFGWRPRILADFIKTWSHQSQQAK